MASGVFADAANTLITFSTPGPDKYADGKVVDDGECYALVWTKAGEDFKGFTTEGEAADPSQKVFYKASLAKGGRCPLTLFQIDSAEAPAGGVYSVYLLDTRGSTDRLVVTGSALAKTYTKGGGMAGTTSVATNATVDASGKPVSLVSTTKGLVDTTGVAAPVIRDFKVVGGQVKITVANVMPGFVYEVKGGLDKKSDVVSTVKANEDNTLELTVDKDAAQFFSIKVK